VAGLGVGDVVIEIAQPGPVFGQGPPVERRFAARGGDGASQVAGRRRLARAGEQDCDVVESLAVGDVLIVPSFLSVSYPLGRYTWRRGRDARRPRRPGPGGLTGNIRA
jgi:hypothetical protein